MPSGGVRARRKPHGRRRKGKARSPSNRTETDSGADHQAPEQKQRPTLEATQSGRKTKLVPAPIKEWVDATVNKGLAGLAQEFATFRNYVPQNISADAFNNHREKNRYKDVLCLDESRVKLEGVEDDYIHASYVSGSRHRRQFICCQGPLDTTISDFWRMIWQEQVPLIVMLCGATEGGKIKCAQYWPLKDTEICKYDEFEIKNVGSRSEKLGSSSECRLTQIQIQTEDGGRRVVQHYQWLDWPDRGVPCSVRALLHLRQRIVKHGAGAPTVIHCSAGIGRTGSVAVLDCCLGQIENDQVCDVPASVRKVRDQRMHSVQNELQYILIHRTLIEMISAKWMLQSTPQLQKFNTDYTNLVERRPAPSPSPAVTPT